MNARFYLPGTGRFASADTIVPDPADPQSLNRYTYARNNPLNASDPTGFWDCASDAEYNRCVEWITRILSLLESDGGPTAHGLYSWFMEYDSQWIERNGIGVLFRTVDDGNFSAAVPICGGATGLCNAVNDPTIEIQRRKLAGLPDHKMAALIGHEMVHLYQGDIDAFSVLGEAGAYYTQASLLQEFRETPEWHSAYFLQEINTSNGSYSVSDVKRARNQLVEVGSYSRLLPTYPLNGPSPTCGYGGCPTPNFYGLVVEPVRFFSTGAGLGVKLPTSTAGSGGNIPR